MNDNIISSLPAQLPSNLEILNLAQNNFLQVVLPSLPQTISKWFEFKKLKLFVIIFWYFVFDEIFFFQRLIYFYFSFDLNSDLYKKGVNEDDFNCFVSWQSKEI